jgi:hypothetical protein
MSNKRMARRPDGGGRPTGYGTTGYDAMAAMINRAIDERVEAFRPRVGTMRSTDGNRVRVDFDDGGSGAAGEAHSQVGGRKRSRGDKDGADRVVMLNMGDGNWVAVGPIIDDGRPDRAHISADDIERDAIDSHHIKDNAIGRRHIPKKLIGRNELDNDAIDQNNLINRFNNELGRDSRISGVDKRVDNLHSNFQSLKDRIKRLDGRND